jgi:hypothetical protein
MGGGNNPWPCLSGVPHRGEYVQCCLTVWKIRYDTLQLPHKVVAQEADGFVKFGQGDGSAYLFGPDIYTDGRILVQGIDGVLVPPYEETNT